MNPMLEEEVMEDKVSSRPFHDYSKKVYEGVLSNLEEVSDSMKEEVEAVSMVEVKVSK